MLFFHYKEDTRDVTKVLEYPQDPEPGQASLSVANAAEHHKDNPRAYQVSKGDNPALIAGGTHQTVDVAHQKLMLKELGKAYIEGMDRVRTWWPNEELNDAGKLISQDAILATQKWLYLSTAAARHFLMLPAMSGEAKHILLAHFKAVMLSSSIETWYTVMKGSRTKRTSYKNSSIAAGRDVYTDFIDENGGTRTIDGLWIGIGVTVPTNFNPSHPSLSQTGA